MKKKIFCVVLIFLVILSGALSYACSKLNKDCNIYRKEVETYKLASLPGIGGKSFGSVEEYIDFMSSEDFCTTHKIRFDFDVKLHYMLEPNTKEDLLPLAGDYSNAVYEISNIEKLSENNCRIFFAIPYTITAGEKFESTRIVYVDLEELSGGLSGITFKSPKATFVNIK